MSPVQKRTSGYISSLINSNILEIAGGAVLLQDDHGKLRPRAYYSTTFTNTERKWKSMIRKEALVIRKAIQFFKKDIKCITPGWITIQTDNQTLRNMIKKFTQYEDDEVQSAAYEVSMVSANIEYILGKENYIADFLSQKEKRENPNEIDRILVGIIDDKYITA